MEGAGRAVRNWFRRAREPESLPGWIAVAVGVLDRLAEIEAFVSLAERLVSPGAAAVLSEWWWLALLLFGALWIWWVSRRGIALEIHKVALVEKGVIPLEGTPIIFIVTVTNTGKPTSLSEWRLSITPPNGTEIELKSWIPDNDWPVGPNIYYREDHLKHKTFEKPVPRGGHVRGFLTGNAIGLPKGESALRHPATTYAVECVDAFGDHHRAEREWGSLIHQEGESVQPTRLPGMKSPDSSVRESDAP